MSFNSPEFSIENASNHTMKLPDNLQRMGKSAHDARCDMDPAVCRLCDMTDSAVLRVLANGA